ncbi:YceI family protein [Mucilaginibacter puniceus]
MKKLLPLIAFLFFITTAFAQVKVTKAKITFQIKNLGINTSGFFSNMQANIQFDPANLAGSSIEATTDVNSINTDNDTRDEHLRSDEFFDAAKYPKITIKAVSFKHKSGNNYSGKFNVTMKDKTKAFEIPFSYIPAANGATFKGSFKLNRLDFGVGEKSLVLSNDVTISIEVETTK